MRGMTPDDLYSLSWLGDCDISADGARVAFVVTTMDRETDAYRSAIWVADVAGGAARQFTAGAKRDTAPRWSPDGQWLAFLSERGEEKPQLAVMPAAGGESRLLTKLPFGAGAPAWAPDSRRIAFSAKTGTPPDPDTKKAKPYRRVTSLKYKLNGEGFTYDRRAHLFVVSRDGGDPAADHRRRLERLAAVLVAGRPEPRVRVRPPRRSRLRHAERHLGRPGRRWRTTTADRHDRRLLGAVLVPRRPADCLPVPCGARWERRSLRVLRRRRRPPTGRSSVRPAGSRKFGLEHWASRRCGFLAVQSCTLPRIAALPIRSCWAEVRQRACSRRPAGSPRRCQWPPPSAAWP